ncbi:MAG: flavin reductase family protein [Acidimicrobiales bacterium]|nr:flavin reductase family protein [Actinomycetota bacterium]
MSGTAEDPPGPERPSERGGGPERPSERGGGPERPSERGGGPEGTDAASINQARFRQILGHFATGVTVVTALDGGTPVGLSVNSFTSVSLDPPLVAFCVARSSGTWPRIREAGRFCVNVLAENQEDVSRVFATRGPDKFQGIGWRPAPSGAPILAGVLAWVDCSLEAEYDGGDHVLVVGRVQELELSTEGGPLIFYRGGYGRFEP